LIHVSTSVKAATQERQLFFPKLLKTGRTLFVLTGGVGECCVCMYVCMYVCMCVRANVCVCVFVFVRVRALLNVCVPCLSDVISNG